MKLNARQLAENLGISYVVSSGLIKLLLEMKQIELAEKVFHSSGKGKPTKIYNFPEEVSIAIKEVVQAEPVVDALDFTMVEEPVAEPVAEEVVDNRKMVTANAGESWYYEDEDDDDDYVDVD